jgi:glutathione S-transferase
MLTFAPTLDSETARLACRWYGVRYEEEDHLFGWSSLLGIAKGGKGANPLLYGPGGRINGSRGIVTRFDPEAPHPRRLLGAGPEAACIATDWQAYNVRMGREVAILAYAHLLPERALMTPILAAPLPEGEARLVPRLYPVLRWLFTALLGLSPERAALAAERIDDVFAATDRRLADGRRFLRGDRLTAGDLAFAGAAAPLLQPAGFGTIMPPIASVPVPLCAAIEALRRHPAARLVERVYAEVPNG